MLHKDIALLFTTKGYLLQKKAITACGFITCAVLCAARFCDVWSDVYEKPNLIIPINMPESDFHEEVHPESFESYQIRILRNQNNVQAENVKVLRDEIIELKHKLHELKPHLFNQSNLADQEKIADLMVKLGEKEKELDRHLEKRQNAEAELDQAKKKLNEMEMVKEALAAMIDKERFIKERNSSEFKRQLEDLRLIAELEKNNLMQKIQHHESNQERLKQEIAEKAQSILRLDAIATQQDAMLTKQTSHVENLNEQILLLYDELLTTGHAYTTQQQASDENIRVLMDILNGEQARIEHLYDFKEKMDWISDLFEGSNAILNKEINLLTSELAEQKKLTKDIYFMKKELSGHNQELNSLLKTQEELIIGLLLHLDYSESALEYHEAFRNKLEEMLTDVSLMYDKQRQKVWDLQSKLDEAVAHQQNVQKVNEEQYTLIEESKRNLAQVEQEIDTYKLLVQQKESQLQALEENQIAADEKISHHFSYYLQKLEDEMALSYNLELMLESSSQKGKDLEKELSEQQKLLIEKEDYIQALREENGYHHTALAEEELLSNTLKEEMQHLQEKHAEEISSYQEALAEKNEELNQGLNQAIQIENHNNMLKQQLSELELIFDDLQSLKMQNDKKDNLISKLYDELDVEKAINSTLHQDLSYARLNYTQENSSRRNLEEILKEAQKQLAELENSHIFYQYLFLRNEELETQLEQAVNKLD